MRYEIITVTLKNIKNLGKYVYLCDFGAVLKPKYRQCSDFIGRVQCMVDENIYQILVLQPELEKYFELYYQQICKKGRVITTGFVFNLKEKYLIKQDNRKWMDS